MIKCEESYWISIKCNCTKAWKVSPVYVQRVYWNASGKAFIRLNMVQLSGLVAAPHGRWHRYSSEPGAPTASGQQIAPVWWSWDPEEPLYIADRWGQKRRTLKVGRKRKKGARWSSTIKQFILKGELKTLRKLLADESQRGHETLLHRRRFTFHCWQFNWFIQITKPGKCPRFLSRGECNQLQ